MTKRTRAPNKKARQPKTAQKIRILTLASAKRRVLVSVLYRCYHPRGHPRRRPIKTIALVANRCIVTRAIKLISFDLDNTLWDVEPVIQSAEAATQAWLEEFCPKLVTRFSAEQLRQARMEYWSNHPEFRHLITRVRRDSLRIKLIEAGYCLHQAIELADMAMDVFMDARHQVTYFEHALTTLNQLAPHFKLAAISNGNASPKRLGLHQFSFHLSAEDVGAAKPSPEPFELAMAMAAVKPSEMIHIGDCPKDDIAAAASLGIKTIWFNPKRAPWPRAEVQPDATVHNLSELSLVIDTLGRPSPLQAQSA